MCVREGGVCLAPKDWRLEEVDEVVTVTTCCHFLPTQGTEVCWGEPPILQVEWTKFLNL